MTGHLLTNASAFKNKVKDDMNHVLTKCPITVQARENFWLNVYNSMPHAMRSDLQGMEKQNALKIMLSGLRDSYIKEWDNIYENIVTQIWEIYNNRALEIDKMLK